MRSKFPRFTRENLDRVFILSQSNSARILNMMKLYVSANSPYARKARIVVRELALEDRVEDVGVVVGWLILQARGQALEAHSRVHML